MAHLPGANGGKGSNPRRQADQKAYADNWDRIFGKKKEDVSGTKKSGEIFEADDSEL
jgi:hypothetical protein